MTSEAKKIARLRLLKRIGLIGLITSGAIGLVFLILSLLPQGNAAFSIRIDNPGSSENANFKIFSNAADASKSTNSKTYLSADPIPSAGLTEAKDVENFLSETIKKKELTGPEHFTREGKTNDLAMIYTIYLTNTSDEDVYVKYALTLDAYKQSNEDAVAPIEYFRVLIQTEEVGSEGTLNNLYYGQKRSGRFDNKYVFDNEEGRETISTPKTYLGDDLKTHVTVADDWSSPGNDGYCINFNDYNLTQDIISSEKTFVKVPVGKIVRYTFVAYFEGGDIDSTIRAQSDNYMLLSLHFGV